MESPFVVIRRGFENAVANWPLVLIRVAEQVALIVLIVLSVFAAVLPFVFLGVTAQFEHIKTPEEFLHAVIEHPFLILLFFLLITVVVIVTVAVHSFVQGGVVGCYLEGERSARRSQTMERRFFRVFTPELWFRYGKRAWWPLFLIYNIAWGVFGLLLLIPLTALGVALFLGWQRPEIIVIACGGLALMFGLMFLGGYIVHLWTTASIVLAVDGHGVGAALRQGWSLFMRRILPFLAITMVVFALSMLGFGTIGAASMGVGVVSSVPGVGLVTLPMQVAISLLQTAFSVALSTWFIAASVSIVLQ